MVRKKKEAKGASGEVMPERTSDSDAARILATVKRIPRGRVSTYGNIADAAGLPRRARLVGTVLRQTAARTPWHRVVNAGGRISFPAGSEAYARQRLRLESERVVFLGGRVDLKHYGWPSRDEQLDEFLWKPRQKKRPAEPVLAGRAKRFFQTPYADR